MSIGETEAEAMGAPMGERDRLRTVAAYQVANAGDEADFDRFASIAADLLGLPIGLMNFVGETEVLITGRHGLDVERVPRNVGFCAHTIHSDDILDVPDLALDRRFAANPLVTEAGLRSYAGAPLRSPFGGARLGALCVLSREPREALNPREARMLESLAALAMDRLELRRAEQARKVATNRFESLAAAFPGALVCADGRGRVTHWNPGAAEIFGWTEAEALGRELAFLVPPPQRAEYQAKLLRLADLPPGAPFPPGVAAEIDLVRRDGTVFPAQITVSCWWEGEEPAFGATIEDITTRRAAENRLRHLAHHDQLTGCVNRARLTELIAACPGPAALVLLDLDGFKAVNDTLGHAAGDELLREVAARFTRALGDRGTLVRLGGDEFAAWLPDTKDTAEAERIAAELIASLSPAAMIAGRWLRPDASAGVTMMEADGAALLLANADLALYRAKAGGKGRHLLYGAAMREEQDERLRLEAEVREAALLGQFELHYQPQIELSSGRLTGAEALLRWRHPERGLLPPALFLPPLEAGPLAGAIGDWVIDEGCRQAAEWRQRGLLLRVGVNLFAEQLRAGGLEETVLAALSRWKLPPEALELELTETIALGQDPGQFAPLHRLRGHGVGLAFDDFGTGFASLSTIKACPLTRLKIDRGFVSGLGIQARDEDDIAIIDAVMALARGLDLGVVAEGIETEAQAAFLAERGCHEGQGFLYGRPAPASAIAALPSGPHPAAGSRRLADQLGNPTGARLGGLAARRQRRRLRG